MRIIRTSRMIRTSDELPDDVGTVFVTDVAGSWFQLVGRRCDGELFVGSVVMPLEGAGLVTEVAAMGAEIVRGPEAETLLKLFDELHGERIWQDVLRSGVEPAVARPENRPKH